MSRDGRARVFITHGPAALEHYYGARALQALQALAEVRQGGPDGDWALSDLVAAAAGCDIIVSDRRAPAPAELFAQLPSLVAFCRCAVDIRNVDVDAASTHGVLVTQASAGFMASVSEWILGVMIDQARGISDAVCAYRAGQAPAVRMGRELRGATLGLIGHGAIGRHLADLALALGMRLLVHDPFVAVVREGVRQVELPPLLAGSDFVVCLAAATPQTEKLMNAEAFATMKPGSFFVNASRGDLVDEVALRAALDSGHLAGAALDVGSAPDQMPAPGLARHPRVIATPHIGGLTPEATGHQAMETVRQVEDLLNGRVPAGAVNAGRATRLAAFFARAKA
jgi:D-3-phosphoglycerate dehydrogenase / 2-oxoglutarate reductase